MAKAEVVPATVDHVMELAQTMRQCDRDELSASSAEHPGDALMNGLMASTQAWAGLVDGEVACMFGVVPASMIGGKGIVWMLASPLIEKHQKAFLRRCRAMVASMARDYPLMHNYVDARNTKSIRWLRWLGFTIEEPETRGFAGLPFHHFYMRT